MLDYGFQEPDKLTFYQIDRAQFIFVLSNKHALVILLSTYIETIKGYFVVTAGMSFCFYNLIIMEQNGLKIVHTGYLCNERKIV